MLSQQIIWLFMLALPIACISWTVTHEEIFREPRDWCVKQSKENQSFFLRKSFYLFTCEYCFSHYITILFLLITRYTLLLPGWKGYLIAGFALVWIANIYIGLFALLRQSIKEEKTKILLEEKEINKKESDDTAHKGKLFNGKRTMLSGASRANHWKDI